MHERIRLDLDAIDVASFETAPNVLEVKGAGLAAATRNTLDICCNGTVCVTRIECSSGTCP